MNKEDVKREIIDFGEYFLKKNIHSEWDFYRKCVECDDLQKAKRYTYGRFDDIMVVGGVVYVWKRDNGRILRGIYTLKGREKIALTSDFIECKKTFLIRTNYVKGWDFYNQQGKRLTKEGFKNINIRGNLVEVIKEKSSGGYVYGVYNTEGKVILPAEWEEISFFESYFNVNPAYIMMRDYTSCWGVCNVEGTFILKPEKFSFIQYIRNEERKCEYLKVADAEGKEGLYELSHKGIKVVIPCTEKCKIYSQDIKDLDTGFRVEKKEKMYYYSFKTKRMAEIT